MEKKEAEKGEKKSEVNVEMKEVKDATVQEKSEVKEEVKEETVQVTMNEQSKEVAAETTEKA